MSILQDLRVGLRALLKKPGFAALAVVTLALGIGANTAIFSVVNGVLLKPLPFADAGRLVSLKQTNPHGAGRNHGPGTYLTFLENQQAFENIKKGLAAVGATFNDVVKTNLYVVGLKPEHVPVIREVRSRFVSAEHPPASTLVGVTSLAKDDWLIEIEAVAVVE